jgi:KUP system potassium uptake protein
MPRVNWLLLAAVLFLVIVFKSSSALASAYGIAVTGTMVVTAIMAFFVMWKCWQWSAARAALVIAPFLVVDVVFLLANALKLMEGGWVPLALGAALMVVMLTWRRGARLLADRMRHDEIRLAEFIRMLEKSSPERVKGTAIFLTGQPDSTPSALLHNLKHNKVLHEKNAILNVTIEDVPRLPDRERVAVEKITDAFARVTLRFGFMEDPNVPRALAACRQHGLKIDLMRTSFFLSRRALRPAAQSRMPRWQEHLFIALARQAHDASQYFGIPTERAVEVGTQIAV